MNKPLKRIFRFLVNADAVFWILPPLMLLLICGTWAQNEIGLWPAIHQYFSGFILWAGPIPLPGAFTLLGLLTLSLVLRFIFKSEWVLPKAGIHLSHLGVIVLLLGGLITAMNATEHYMVLPENAQSQYVYSYQKREFLVYKGENLITKSDYDDIESWNFSSLPFEIHINAHCENCEIIARNTDTPETYKAMAANMAFQKTATDPQPELNLTGLEFTVKGTNEDGTYIAFDGMPQPIRLTHENAEYTIIFGKAQTELPFAIRLKDFQKQDYAGTNLAKNYTSEVEILDGDQIWPATIEMNKPLRYQGYTFYQSSFDQTASEEISILAVVRNKGQIFPYIGALIIAAGLLLHIIMISIPRNKKTA